MAGDADTSRSVVQVYVPTYQRDAWDEHADELEMSRSEFVKAMVQAGRRGFGADPADGGDSTEHSGENSTEGLEKQVLSSLEREGCLSWDDLLKELTDDIETRLEATLQELQEEGTVRYSGRDGGYVLESGPEHESN
jgi:hypothetical protein